MLHFTPPMETVGLATPMTIAPRMGSRWSTTTPAFVNHTFPVSVSVNDKTRTGCRCRGRDDDPLSTSSAYAVLGVQPNCSAGEIKAAFRAKVSTSIIKVGSPFSFIQFMFFFLFNLLQVKQFHPDLNRDENETSDVMIRRVIQAYQVLLSSLTKSHCFCFTFSIHYHTTCLA